MRKALIVIDMVKGFFVEGNALYCGPEARKIIPFVKAKLEECEAAGDLIVFVCDNHDPDDKEFAAFPPHCVKGTEETEVVDELKEFAGRHPVLPKRRYSAFFDTTLGGVLQKAKPELVEVVGVCTNICVLFTVEDARNGDYPVRVYAEGVASFDQEAHEFALKQMETVLAVEVVRGS
ncbi:MAG: cysteine hydrolase [Planctomycetes bacterium]|nr:cysteine hydrolase [Planctomycetota bacterium]